MSTSASKQVERLKAWFLRRTAPSAVRRVVQLKSAIASDVGAVRDENQDRVVLVQGFDGNGSPFVLAAIADGIGGMKQGAECAALTLATFVDTLMNEALNNGHPKEWLRVASHQANQNLHAAQHGHGGSTLAAVLFASGRQSFWLSIGDSRVYHDTGETFTQLSKDDTIEGQLGRPVEGGRKSELLQFVGIGEGLEPHIEPAPSDSSGTLLLTTDGVHFIDADYLGRVVRVARDVGMCARNLVEMAKILGGPDNASVVVLGVDVLSEASDFHMDSGYEIWDPFGELRVILDHNRKDTSTLPSHAHNSGDPYGRSPLSGAGAELHNEHTHDATPHDPARAKSPIGPKGKGGRKAKPKGAKRHSENDQQDESKDPELFIEFPNKAH